MNTFTNVLGIAALITLVLLPALAGLAREHRIDRELRAAERERSDGPPETTGAAPTGTAGRRPPPPNWGRGYRP
ncbi:hypothetical protein ACFVH0_27720, partial [Streptomyces sp. NPDC127117]|uniref:hypothetical protein n=1 Tax=Streptomyces sp. NPDC127117 TaxID=3345368 RepID=UPI00362B772A